MNPNYPKVASRARHICEYCHAPEVVFNFPFEVEHIIPLSRKGSNDLENLALSCRSCNLYKSNSIAGFDEFTRQEVEFYNPRKDIWTQHFSIDETTGEVKSLSEIGRITVSSLRINSLAQIAARIQWLKLELF